MNLLTKIRSISVVVAVVFLLGCTTIDPQPFVKFNESLNELNKGAVSSLDVTIPLAKGRYQKELEEDMMQGNDTLLQQLSILVKINDPFFISNPPVFLKAMKFKLGISKTNLVWVEYSKLLLQLSSKEFVNDDEFVELSKKLNENAFDAVQSLKDDPSVTSAENTALFSELAITFAKEYIRTKQKEKLIDSITSNQDSIKNYVRHMQSATVIMAQSTTQEHSEQHMSLALGLTHLVLGNENGKNNAKIQKTIGDLIEVKTMHSGQMASLQALHSAYEKIPDAHEALSKQLSKSGSSLAAITDLLEHSIKLHSSYKAKAKVNQAELVQAKADAANSKAIVSEMRYQQVKLKTAQAQFEYTLAENALSEDSDNEVKKKDADDKKVIAEQLKIEADSHKNSAEALRASATAVQESANEVKSSIINN
jgi:hypothetical protein